MNKKSKAKARPAAAKKAPEFLYKPGQAVKIVPWAGHPARVVGRGRHEGNEATYQLRYEVVHGDTTSRVFETCTAWWCEKSIAKA